MKTNTCCKKCLKCPDYAKHDFCHNKDCLCHSSQEDNYKHQSHTHCWNQGGNPPCRQPLSNHKQCCLCDSPSPQFLLNNGNGKSTTNPLPEEKSQCCEKCLGSISGIQWWCNNTDCPCHSPQEEVEKCPDTCFPKVPSGSTRLKWCDKHFPQATEKDHISQQTKMVFLNSWEELTNGMNENNIKEWSAKFVAKNSINIVLTMCSALTDALMQHVITETRKKD